MRILLTMNDAWCLLLNSTTQQLTDEDATPHSLAPSLVGGHQIPTAGAFGMLTLVAPIEYILLIRLLFPKVWRKTRKEKEGRKERKTAKSVPKVAFFCAKSKAKAKVKAKAKAKAKPKPNAKG